MTSMLMMKANALGISDAECLTEIQLEQEIEYASLSRTARTDIPRQRGVVGAITCTTVPDPIYFPAGRPSMTREQLRKGVS